MKILGVSLGHDSNLSLIQDGKVIEVMEVERRFRQKRYKLHAIWKEKGKHPLGFQYVDIADLEFYLTLVSAKWGNHFDALAVQNQKRIEEYDNFLSILNRFGFTFKNKFNVNHHLSHAALAFYTSPFSDALILSYDGAGNDGFTILFSGSRVKGLEYIHKNPIKFGASYNNMGFIAGVKAEICGTTSGKTMGLTAYGENIEEWTPYILEYIHKYEKIQQKQITGLNKYGAAHTINSISLNNIPYLQKYLQKGILNKSSGIIERAKSIFKSEYQFLQLPGPKEPDSQNFAKSVQTVWSNEVIKIVEKNRNISKNLCIVGGCALNGITNYVIQEKGMFEKLHFVPNPSDCGLSIGAAMHVYYDELKAKQFNGYGDYFSPYLGEEAFDKNDIQMLKTRYPNRSINEDELPDIMAKLIWKDLIIGIIRGRYEIGPRALGNRTILCNPLNKDMRDILNDKVKNREWYRPFAPIIPIEDSQKYFTNTDDIFYMSVICYTREQYRDLLPSITHVDGSARLQTVRREHHPFMHKTLKAFEKYSGMPILLNTSFNPAGEPILNYYRVGLEMLEKTGLDLVLIETDLFAAPGKEDLLNYD